MDGQHMTCKKTAHDQRDKQRQQFYQRSKETKKNIIDIEDSLKFERYSSRIPEKLVYFFIDYLKYREIYFVISPYEADFQLAKMYEEKVLNYIWSEDSDILVYGCKNIIKGVD